MALPPARSLIVCSALLTLVACGGGGPPGGPGGAGGFGGMASYKPNVTVVTLKSQPVALTRELPGRTSAFLVADVRPQVNGIIKRRLFEEGSVVHAGQPLYDIDDAIYRAQVDSAAAAVKKAEASAVAAQLAAKRSRELIKIDAISAQDNDNAVAAEGQANADVAAARAALDTANVNLAYAHIVAPITGRIGKSMVTQGALATADQSTPLATVQQLDPIYIDVNQSSAEWLALKQEIDSGRVTSQGAGTPVQIVLENGSRYQHEGKLQFADVTVDPTTGNFLLRVLVPNPEGLLMPGMYVRAVLDEGVLPNGVLAPQEGIAHDPKGDASALVVDAQDKVQERKVNVTREVGNAWLIDDGLAAGDKLIVAGVQKVQPGMTVQPVEAPPNAAPPAPAPSAGAARAPSPPAAHPRSRRTRPAVAVATRDTP